LTNVNCSTASDGRDGRRSAGLDVEELPGIGNRTPFVVGMNARHLGKVAVSGSDVFGSFIVHQSLRKIEGARQVWRSRTSLPPSASCPRARACRQRCVSSLDDTPDSPQNQRNAVFWLPFCRRERAGVDLPWRGSNSSKHHVDWDVGRCADAVSWLDGRRYPVAENVAPCAGGFARGAETDAEVYAERKFIERREYDVGRDTRRDEWL